MIKRLLPLAAAALMLAGTAARAEFKDFKVDEGSVPGGTVANVLTADKLNGGYTEYLAVTGPTTFASSGFANFGQFFMNEGTTLVSSQLNGFGAGGYGMYALFTTSGNITGPNLFNTTAGSFTLYIDPDKDTNFSAATSNGIVPVSPIGGTADDYQIAFSNTIGQPSTGNLTGPPGAFNLYFTDFTLTTGDQNGSTAGVQNGSLYFIDPNPFYMLVQVNGDYDQFIPGNPSLITGDVSAVFPTPEPASLALVGLALGALGWSQRRKST